jgi:hypothetical protein
MGLSFENAAKDKTTKITASFNPTSGDSPAGDRVITVPDLPSGTSDNRIGSRRNAHHFSILDTSVMVLSAGGALHVVTKGSGRVSNVGQITMHTSAGVLESNPGRLLAAGESETLFLANRLIKVGTCQPGAASCTDPGTVVIVTIADYGAGGQLFVKAAKVGPTDGQVTIVTQNIGADAMTQQYKVAFALFN